jgi:hypothetical protein
LLSSITGGNLFPIGIRKDPAQLDRTSSGSFLVSEAMSIDALWWLNYQRRKNGLCHSGHGRTLTIPPTTKRVEAFEDQGWTFEIVDIWTVDRQVDCSCSQSTAL